MCGIVGYIGKQATTLVAQAVPLLSHRGPDDRGVFEDLAGEVALGHTRLSIIDLSPLGHQPMISADGRVALTFNGEIYNYRELRSRLEKAGHVFRGQSDTEVLLQLYVSEGEKFLQELNGIFALALYDRHSHELLLARDGMGVKPLYFSDTAHGFGFASEIKALKAMRREPWSLDPLAIQRYVSFLWCPGERTPIQEVRKLGPGEAMVVREGHVSRRWAWYVQPQGRLEASVSSCSNAILEVQSQLRAAVHRQLVADVPVGAFLSGGLDSSSVVAFAREQAPHIQCFTIDASSERDDGEVPDLPFARRAAAHLGVDLHVVSVDASRMAQNLERMVWSLDEPLADPASLNVLFISELARSHGIKVLLSGTGGDDLFTGYRRHVALKYEHLWNWLPNNARDLLKRSSDHLDQRLPAGRRISRLLRNASADQNERLAGYFFWMANDRLAPLYSASTVSALQGCRPQDPFLEFLSSLPASTPAMDRLLALEQRFFLADHNLIYTDKMSMAAGVEVRVPFLDPGLVDAAARIPNAYKQHGREGKWVLKKAMEPFLPPDIIYRSKTGFGAPVRRWIRGELRPLVRDLLSPLAIARRGVFEPAAVERLIAENDAGKLDGAYTILALLCIEMWCRLFLD